VAINRHIMLVLMACDRGNHALVWGGDHSKIRSSVRVHHRRAVLHRIGYSLY